MHRIVVLLPDPLGPRKPVTRPGWTSKLRSSTATVLPNRLVSLRTSITGPYQTTRQSEKQPTPQLGDDGGMSEPFFTEVTERIPYEGPDSDNPLAFHWYDADRVVAGRRMEDHLRFAVCYWHSFNWDGFDIFGAGTLDRPWHPTFAPAADPIDGGPAEDGRRVRVLRQARRARSTASTTATSRPRAARSRSRPRCSTRWSTSPPSTRSAPACELLWGTANLFSNPRYQAGAATNPDPEVFAYAAAQVAHCLEATHRLGGHNYVLWGGREGYDTLLNTDLRRELDQLARFLSMVVEHKHRIGFTGTILIEPKPFEPTKHQYDYDVAAVHAFLQRYDLADEIKVNIEVNHATLVRPRLRPRGRHRRQRRDLRVDRRQRRRRPPRLGRRPLPGVGRADDARHARDPARRRVHHRRPQLRRQAAPPVDRPHRPVPRPHRRDGHDGAGAAGRRRDLATASSTPTATPATPAGTASSAARSSTGRPPRRLHDRALDRGEPARVSGGQERLENLVARHVARVR